MPKAAPFSMRLSDVTDQLVSEEARRTRRTKGAVVEGLAEEALRTRRFPGIAFRGSDWNRRPWVIGTALDVWEIVAAARSYGTPREMEAATDLTEPQIRLALAYYASSLRRSTPRSLRTSDLSQSSSASTRRST